MFFSMFCCLCFFEGAALAHPTIVTLKLFCLPYIGQRRMLIDIYTCWFSGGLLTYNRFIQGGLLKCWSHSSSFLFPFFFRSRYFRPLFRCFNITYVQPSTGMSFFRGFFPSKTQVDSHQDLPQLAKNRENQPSAPRLQLFFHWKDDHRRSKVLGMETFK